MALVKTYVKTDSQKFEIEKVSLEHTKDFSMDVGVVFMSSS